MYFISNPLDLLSLLTTNVFYGCETLNIISLGGKKTNTLLIPNSVISLGESAFENCQSIDDVYIEMNYDNIPKNSFKNCYNLSNVYFKENTNIMSIYESAFENCSSIRDLEFPRNIELIGVNSFKNCSNMEILSVYNNDNIDIDIDTNSFTECDYFVMNNGAVIFTDNPSFKNYFTTKFPNTKQLSISSISAFKKFIYLIGSLFDYNPVMTKTYFYPSFDIKLSMVKQMINIDLVNENIDINKQSQFRNLILQFIFEINKSYNSFVINNKNLKLNIGLGDTFLLTVYNSLSRNIDTFNDININNCLAIYGLLENNYSEVLVNNYKVRLSIGVDNKYNIEYSTDNFVNSTQLLGDGDKNTTTKLTNYNILTGDYNDFIIYKDIYTSSINVYLEGLQLNINASLSKLLNGQTTDPMTANAYAKLDIPLSTVINTFMYWSDGINVDDNGIDGIKFKTVNHLGWQNIYLARATTSSEFGGIPYYKPGNNIMSTNKIKYDFLRYLAKSIFKTSSGVDIFSNNQASTDFIETNAQLALINRLSELENLGELTNEITQHNIAGIIFNQILQQQPGRISPNDGTWTPMHLYSNDKIYIKLTINPAENQHKLINPNNNTPIPERSYLIELTLISG